MVASAAAAEQAQKAERKKATDRKGRPLPAAAIPVPRNDAGWQKRHESMNARVAKGNVDLVMIGDSITQGWEGAGKRVWDEYYGQRNAVNLGIGGDQTQHVLWRLQNGNLKGISPKLAVLMIGTNNTGGKKPEEIAQGIRAIVRELRRSVPDTKVLVLAIFPRGPNNDDPLRKVVVETNQIVAGSRRIDGQQVKFKDIGPKFLQPDGTLSKEIMPDLLHLSPKGYQIWAESIEPEVAEALGPKK
jgi:beta-glucosidase